MIDRIGKKYGKLTVISLAYNDRTKSKTSRIAWNCKCDCGNLCVAIGHSLKVGRKKHCGCDTPPNPNTRPPGMANLTRLFGTYKNQAKKRNHSWELTIDEFEIITSKDCNYCGKEPVQIISCKRGNGNYIYNGIDRVNNELGYDKNNIVPCCKQCNWAKVNLSKNEFLAWIKRVYENNFIWSPQ